MMKQSRFRGKEQNLGNSSDAFREDRHRINLWSKLLPNAKQKLIDAGLFTPEGKITKLGLDTLRDMN